MSAQGEGGTVLRCGDWPAMREAAMPVRSEVFIVEQAIPAELEWDDDDALSLHCVAFVEERPVACGRLLPDGRIGRMAVLKSWRGRGLGGAVLERLVDAARARGDEAARLSAQCHAEGFYRAHGFLPAGPVFDEAGIAHLPMQRSLR